MVHHGTLVAVRTARNNSFRNFRFAPIQNPKVKIVSRFAYFIRDFDFDKTQYQLVNVKTDLGLYVIQYENHRALITGRN